MERRGWIAAGASVLVVLLAGGALVANANGRTTALAGASALGALGLPGTAQAVGKKHPKRGGTLRLGIRDDSVALDTNHNLI